eukprot:s2258_g9.t1
MWYQRPCCWESWTDGSPWLQQSCSVGLTLSYLHWRSGRTQRTCDQISKSSCSQQQLINMAFVPRSLRAATVDHANSIQFSMTRAAIRAEFSG